MEKDYLVLKRASASRTSGEWREDDFDVLADGVVVGRIMKAEAAPGRDPMDVAAGFRPSRRPHAHSRICGDTRGRHGGIREELAAGMKSHEKAPPVLLRTS